MALTPDALALLYGTPDSASSMTPAQGVPTDGAYRKQSDLPALVALSPDEQAADEAYERTPAMQGELLKAIDSQGDPKRKAILQDEYNKTFGNGGAPADQRPVSLGAERVSANAQLIRQKAQEARAMAREIRGTTEQDDPYAQYRNRFIPIGDEGFQAIAQQQVAAQPKDGFGAALKHGASDAFKQIPELIYGTAAFLGDAMGVDWVKNAGLTLAKEKSDEIAKDAKPYQDIGTAWDKGELIQWAGYALGYSVSQIAQAMATGGAGSFIAKVGAKNLLAGTAERAAAEALDRMATGSATVAYESTLKTGAQETAARAAGDAAYQATLTNAEKIAASKQIGQQAAALAAAKFGGAIGLGANSEMMEIGQIYPDAVDEAQKRGDNDPNLARVLGGATAAASLDVLPEMRIGSKILGTGGKVAKDAEYAKALKESQRGIGARLATEIPKQAAFEGATEGMQTPIEHWSASQDPTSPDAVKDALNSAAMGAVGGVIGGVGAGVPKPAAPVKETPAWKPNSPLSNAAQVGSLASPAADQELADLTDAERKDVEVRRDGLNFATQAKARQPEIDAGQTDIDAQAAQDALEARPLSGLPDDVLQSTRERTAKEIARTVAETGTHTPEQQRAIQNLDYEIAQRSRPAQMEPAPQASLVEPEAPRADVTPVATPAPSTDATPVVSESPVADVAPAPARPHPAVAELQQRTAQQRHDSIRELVGQGFTTVYKDAENGGGFVLAHPKTNQKVSLNSPADVQVARAAILKQVDDAAHTAAASPRNDLSEPSEGQIAAGNYKLGHIDTLHGIPIAIENPEGSTRAGVSPEGKPWETTLASHYGYIKKADGADGDKLDVFIGKRPDSQKVYVVDQTDKQGNFDEHKVMMGFTDEASARAGYLANYEKGWNGLGAITEMSIPEFKEWIKGDTTKPLMYMTKAELAHEDMIERARAVYGKLHEQGPHPDMANQELWKEQIGEKLLNPQRYNKVVEDENPKGLRIGDHVRVSEPKQAPFEGIVVSVEKTAARAYAGGYMVHVVENRNYGGFVGIDDVEKMPEGGDHAVTESGAAETGEGATEGELRQGRAGGDSGYGVRDHAEKVRGAEDGAVPLESADESQRGPGREAVESEWIRPEIEALIHKRATAARLGFDKALSKAIDAAKSVLHQEAVNPGVFKSRAVEIAKKDAETGAIVQRIYDRIKAKSLVAAAGAKKLMADYGAEHIDGYQGEPGGGDEALGSVKAGFLKDAKNYLNAVATVLKDAGFDAQADRKGKPGKAVSVNEAGPAVSGEVSLTMQREGVNVYVDISGSAMRSEHASNIQVMWRASNAAGDTFANKGMNHFAKTDLTAQQLAATLKAEADRLANKNAEPMAEFQKGDTVFVKHEAGQSHIGEPGYKLTGYGTVESADARNKVSTVTLDLAGTDKKVQSILRHEDMEPAERPAPEAAKERWETFEIAEAARAKNARDKRPRYIVREPAANGGHTNLAEFTLGANGKAQNVRQFHQAQEITGAVDKAIARWIGENGKKSTMATPGVTAVVLDSKDIAKGDAAVREKIAAALEGQAKPAYGSTNTMFTADAAEKARALLKSKLGQLNAGIDPELLQAGLTLAGYHMEAGVRSFAAVARAIASDLGVSLAAIKPYLRGWYNGARDTLEDGGHDINGMDDADRVKAELADPAYTSTQEVQYEQAGNGAASEAALESPLSSGVQPVGEERGLGQRGDGSGEPDTLGNGYADDRGLHDGSSSVGSGEGAVHLDRPAEDVSQGLAPTDPIEADKSDPPISEPKAPKLLGENPGNYAITAADDLGEGSRGNKIDDNLDAIRLVKRLEAEGRFATPAEQAILVKYTGWGGLKNVFDPTSKKPQDQKARAELERLLSEPEMFWAGQSVLWAHYTSKDIIGAMYRFLDHIGFRGGNVLEPTVGVGHFIGLMPEGMRDSAKWYASEIDPITSLIAKHLYPESRVLVGTGFQKAEFPYGKFDLAIGNPPFGSERIADTNPKRAAINRFKIHNYIIAKSGMHLKPGGVMAMVVTSRFLDTKDAEARDLLAQNFKLLGAVRLPNNAFAKNAGTDVTTDLIFMQKLMPGEAQEANPDWLETGATMFNKAREEVTLNKYFANRPHLMLGEPSMHGTMYGGKEEFTLTARPNQDTVALFNDLLAGEFAGLHDQLARDRNAVIDSSSTSIEANREDVPVGGFITEGDKIFMRVDDDANGNVQFTPLTPKTPWSDALVPDGKGGYTHKHTKGGKVVTETYRTEADVPNSARLGEKKFARIRGMLDLREKAYALIRAERADASNIELLRSHLNDAYDAFQAEFGYVSDPANASLMSDDVRIESGLEANYRKEITAARAKVLNTQPSPAYAEKATLLKQRMFFPYHEVLHADTPTDGYAVSLSEKGKLDLDYISQLTNQSRADVIAELSGGDKPLIFRNPETGEWVQEDEYLSGNVKAKLRAVEGKAGFEKNAEALRAVLPKDIPYKNIFADLGATWIPATHYQDFLDMLGVKEPKVFISNATGGVNLVKYEGLDSNNAFAIELANPDIGLADLFNLLANKKPLVAYDTVPADGGGTTRVVNRERTKALAPIGRKMGQLFKDWVFADEARALALEKIYNDTQNTTVERQFNGKHLRMVGNNPAVVLRDTQANAAWRMIQSPIVLLDHVVGAGKTYTLITGILERKRLGLTAKPMLTVPNHLVGQWAKDFLTLYPGAHILAATEKDFTKPNRRRLFAKIATGNYDAIIVGHSSFGFIPVDAAMEERFVMAEVEHLQVALEDAKEGGDKRTVRTIKDRIAKRMERIKALQDKARDNVATFEDMGVDYLAVDESHLFKNLEYSTAMGNMAGMGNPAGSKKAFDLYMKLRLLEEKNGGVAFATGTPISNSLVEMYSLMRYLNSKGLRERGIEAFDAWAKSYASIESRIEYTASQKLKERSVMAAFNNVPEMLQLYRQFSDSVTMQDLKDAYVQQIRRTNAETGAHEREEFPVPKVEDGGRQLDTAPPSEAQVEFMDYLAARANQLEKAGKNFDPKIDNALWIYHDAKMMSLDIRLVDPLAPEDANNKINRAARRIKSYYDKWDADKGTQLVFCDLSTPVKTAGKDAKGFIKDGLKLLDLEKDARTQTIMENMTWQEKWRYLQNRMELAIESDDTSDEKREALEKFIAESTDGAAALTTADVGFSVYDSLRDKLISLGIPAGEVRFIHDANTAPQKQELFDQVNAGSVRVMVGSTTKMGAGTNAQKRIVALHHLDSSMHNRPADIEQREGRGIRQGNMLYERDPDGFRLGIHAYSTDGTFDAVGWQILARKGAMIEGFRNGSERTLSDPDSDSSSYAQFMAETTGNPVFVEKIKLENSIEELEATERRIRTRRYSAERTVADGARNVVRDTRTLDDTKKEAALIGDSGFTYNGRQIPEDLDTVVEQEQEAYRAEYKEFEEQLVAYGEARKRWDEENAVLIAEKGSAGAIKAQSPKPKKPAEPHRPAMFSERVRAKSREAQAMYDIAHRLKEMHEGDTLTVTLGQLPITFEKFAGEERTFTYHADSPEGALRAQSGALKDAPLHFVGETITGARRAMARNLENAEWQLDNTKRSIETAKTVLETLQFKEAAELATKKKRLDEVMREVGDLEAELDAKRASQTNRFVDADKKRFPNGYTYQTDKPLFTKEIADKGNYIFGTGAEYKKLTGKELPKGMESDRYYLKTEQHGEFSGAPKDGFATAAEAKEWMDKRIAWSQQAAAAKAARPAAPAPAINNYHYRSGGYGVEVVGNAKPIVLPALDGYSFFTYKGEGSDKLWHVVEDTTGLSLGRGETQKSAIDSANEAIGRIGVEKIISTIDGTKKITNEDKIAAAKKFESMESRGDAEITGATPADIRAAFVRAFGERTVRQLEQNGRAQIVATVDALPAGVPVSGRAKAIFAGNKAYFIADRMDPETAHREMLHEIGEHYGLEKMLGEEGYRALADRIAELAHGGDTHAAAAWAFVKGHYPELKEGSARFMHEVMAQLGQHAETAKQSWFHEIVAAVKRFLVKMGFTGKITVADLQDMVMHSLMVASRPEGGGPRGGLMPAMASNARDGIGFAHEILNELAGVDALFRYPTTRAGTVQGAIRDVFPGAQYVVDGTRFDEKAESGADHRYVFMTPETTDSNGDVVRNGKQFDVYLTPNRVWVDLQHLEPGDQGSRIYSAIADFAHTTRRVFGGDPAGVSKAAIVARNKMMLASALKYGETRHLDASREQERGDPDEGIAPLDWSGSDLEKTQALIHTYIATVHANAPDIKHFRYDFAKKQFVDTRTGQEFRPASAAFDAALGEDQRRAARIGKDSGRAAIVIQSLVSGEGGSLGDAGVRQDAYNAPRALIDAGLTGMFSKQEQRTLLSDDLEQQSVYLTDQAKGAGFDNIEDFITNDFAGFNRAAENWRAEHPVTTMESRGDYADMIRGMWGDTASRRRADIKANVSRGFTLVERDDDGKFVLRSPINGKSMPLNSPAEVQIARTAVRAMLPEWVAKQPPESWEAYRKAGAWSAKPTLIARLQDMKDDLGIKVLSGALDQFAPVLQRFGEMPYKLLRMASSASGGMDAAFHHGRIKLNSAGAIEVVKGSKSFLEIMKPLHGEVERFLSWVAGNRSAEITRKSEAALAEIRKVDEEIAGWKYTLAQSREVEDKGGAAKIEAHINALERQRAQLQKRADVKERNFTPEEVADLMALNGKANEDDNLADGTDGKERAKIYAAVLKDYNEFSKSFLDIAEKSGLIDGESRATWENEFYVPFFRQQEEGAFDPSNVSGMVNQEGIHRMKGGKAILNDLLVNTLQNWNHLVNASLRNNAAKATLDRAEFIRIAHRVPGEEKGAVFVMKNGQKVYYHVDDPLVLDAISSLQATDFKGPIMKALSAFKHILTAGVTMSPTFRIRNTIRDQISAMATNPTTYNVMTNLIDGFKYSSHNNPEYGTMLAGGAIFRMGMALQDANANYAKRMIEEGVDVMTLLDHPGKVKDALKRGFDWWKETGERSESITRANVYRQVYDAQIKEGVGHDMAHFQAAYAARDVLDFGLRGTWPALRMITQVVPFMNARLQGLYKLGRGAVADPRRFAAVAGGITLASIMLMLAYRDDPDWDRRPEWDRDNNWFFKIGSVGYRIPKPFELGALATVVERGLETMLNGFGKVDRERFVSRLWAITADQLNMNPTPQGIYPALQLWANKDAFRGAPIESIHDQNLAKSQRIGPNTTATAQLLGKAGLFSPEQIDFLVNAYFGWVGSHVTATVDLALRPIMGLPDKASPRIDDYFLIGDFARQLPANQSRFQEGYYAHMAKVQEAFESMRELQRTGQAEGAREYMLDHADEIRLHSIYTHANAELTRINSQLRSVMASTTLSPDEKAARRDQLAQLKIQVQQNAEAARAR